MLAHVESAHVTQGDLTLTLTLALTLAQALTLTLTRAHVESAHIAQGDAKLEAVSRVRATERVEGGPPRGPRCQNQLARRAW